MRHASTTPTVIGWVVWFYPRFPTKHDMGPKRRHRCESAAVETDCDNELGHTDVWTTTVLDPAEDHQLHAHWRLELAFIGNAKLKNRTEAVPPFFLQPRQENLDCVASLYPLNYRAPRTIERAQDATVVWRHEEILCVDLGGGCCRGKHLGVQFDRPCLLAFVRNAEP